ncbi:MAG: hypothetical protein IJS17_05395 [Clostridia bacterium]|nr:hypothetical protein [Clostridia bacterium]
MKKIFAFLLAAVIAAGVFLAFKKSDLIGEMFSGVPENVAAYSPDSFYYRNLSSEKSKKAYDIIMREIFSFPEKILIPNLSDTELDEVYEAVLYDNTETFFLGETCSTKSSGAKTYFYPKYALEKAQYEQRMSELESAEDEIVAQVATQDEFEKELFLHDTLLKTCSYSDDISSKTSTPYACLVEKSASCEGYAKAMKRLLEKCSIECILAIGKVVNEQGADEGHMWDIVKINGKYYHLDPTWDDNNNDNSRLTYTYFNDNDLLITKTHSVQDRFLNLCSDLDDNFFVKTSAYFTDYNEDVKNKISALITKNTQNGLSLAPFMFENEDDYQSARRDLFDNEGIYRLLERADLVTDKKIVTDRVYYWPDDTFYVISIFNYF